jgi:hypothetical protein
MTKSVAKNEVWRWIPTWEGRYMVSNLGNIISTPTEGKNGVMLQPRKQNLGYLQVRLKDTPNNRDEWWYVHRLVATAFLPKSKVIPNASVVMHKDDNPLNNCVDNLRWGTQKMNMEGVDWTKRRNPVRCAKGKREGLVKDVFILNKDNWGGKRSELLEKIAEELDLSVSYVNTVVYQNLKDWKAEENA